jgi:hypothetical protein
MEEFIELVWPVLDPYPEEAAQPGGILGRLRRALAQVWAR